MGIMLYISDYALTGAGVRIVGRINGGQNGVAYFIRLNNHGCENHWFYFVVRFLLFDVTFAVSSPAVLSLVGFRIPK